MSDLYNNIEILCKQKHISITTMCKEAGVSRGSLTDLKSGRSRLLSSEALSKIAKFFGVDVSWLMGLDVSTAEKAMVLFDDETREILSATRNRPEVKKLLLALRKLPTEDIELITEIVDRFKSRDHVNRRTITISRSLLSASAGAGEYLTEGNYEPREFPDVPAARQADVVIPVSGRSMEPRFYDGDELYVRIQPSVNIGETGIFIYNGEGYVKEAGDDRLISINPDYPDIKTNGAPIMCFGKVLGKVEKE